jgi:excisionase family DNA binding protein
MILHIPNADSHNERSPVTITVVATRTRFAFSFTGSGQMIYKDSQLSSDGNGLIQAVIQALQLMTGKRRTSLLALHHSALLKSQPNAHEGALPLMLPVTIRTSSAQLIEASIFLRTKTTDVIDLDAVRLLRHHFRRFDIRWQLIRPGAAELKSLRRFRRRPSSQFGVSGIDIDRSADILRLRLAAEEAAKSLTVTRGTNELAGSPIDLWAAADITEVFEPLLGVVAAAKLLCVHPKTLQALARAGSVPCIRCGKYWRFRASSLDAWVRERLTSDHQSRRAS